MTAVRPTRFATSDVENELYRCTLITAVEDYFVCGIGITIFDSFYFVNFLICLE